MYDDPPQTFNRLRGSQNWVAGPPQGFNYPNVPGEHLQGFNRFCGSQNWLAEQQALVSTKTAFSRLSTAFLAVKTVAEPLQFFSKLKISQNRFVEPPQDFN